MEESSALSDLLLESVPALKFCMNLQNTAMEVTQQFHLDVAITRGQVKVGWGD